MGNVTPDGLPTATTVSAADAVGIAPPAEFQGVALEEHLNSYNKQYGRYGLHASHEIDQPPLGAAAGTSVVAMSPAWGVESTGDAKGGTLSDADLVAFFEAHTPTALFAVLNGYGALVPHGSSNRLIVWGPPFAQVDAGSAMGDVASVYSNRYTFAFLYRKRTPDGRCMGAIGDAKYGGVIPDVIQLALAADPARSLRATDAAFAVVTASGMVYAWGGGAAAAMPESITSTLRNDPIVKLFAASDAFCGITKAGAIVSWGAASALVPAEIQESVMDDGGASTLICAREAFCCITVNRRKIFCWGAAVAGGKMDVTAAAFASRGDVIACKAAGAAFAAVNASGQVAAWGAAGTGGTIPEGVTETGTAGAESAPSGDSVQSVETELRGMTLAGDTEARAVTATFGSATWSGCIYAVDRGFCILTRWADQCVRSVVAWGAVEVVPPQAVKQVLLASRLRGVVTNARAFLAVLEAPDTVVTWGDAAQGGLLPAEARQAIRPGSVSAMPVAAPGSEKTTDPAVNTGFILACDDGSYVMWGSAVGTVRFPQGD